LAADDYAAFANLQDPLVGTARGDFPYFHWPYPPQALLLVAPFGLRPYVPAFVAWVATTGALYLATILRIMAARRAIFVAPLPLSVPMDISSGQTSFLLAALLGTSLVLIPTRPVLVGVCLGLLTYKHNYGPLFPLVLAIAGQWRVVASAALTVIAFAGAATLAFGIDVWGAYRSAMAGMNPENFTTDAELDAVVQTVFGVMHWLGAPLAVKWAAHLATVVPVAIVVCVIWRRPVPDSVKAGALACGALLVTPYMVNYDFTALAIPAAFLARAARDTSFRACEHLLLLAAVLSPWASIWFPVGPFVLAALLFAIAHRAFMNAVPVSPMRP